MMPTVLVRIYMANIFGNTAFKKLIFKINKRLKKRAFRPNADQLRVTFDY